MASPGTIGGMTWSGYAFDPRHNVLVVNTNNFPTQVKLIPRAEFDDARRRSVRRMKCFAVPCYRRPFTFLVPRPREECCPR